MSDDSDFDDIAHEKLLKSVTSGKGLKKTVKRKSTVKLSADDLLTSIKSKRSSLGTAKKNSQTKKDGTKFSTDKTLSAPLHRQALEKIQGSVGFIELKKDLSVWNDVVTANRTAEQLQFPLNQQEVLSVDTASAKAERFRPKTEMELEMDKLLKSSKNNLNNETVYTEAEMEIIRAMNLKEAKAKLSEMQKLRALVSYKEAKYRYAAKIKSKGYHRILKRQKRKQLVKEFDELLVRDPEAAKEKLKELETMRVLERGSLKHHARTKFQRDILKHAGKEGSAKSALEEHLKLGRDLKSKVGLESDSEDEKEEKKSTSVADIIRSAALAAVEDDDSSTDVAKMDPSEARKKLYEMRTAKRLELQSSKMKTDGNVVGPSAIFEENTNWTEEEPKKTPPKKTRKRKVESVETLDDNSQEDAKSKDIDEIFNDAEDKFAARIRKEAQSLKDKEETAEKPTKKSKKLKKPKNDESQEKPSEAVDISVDPKHFLQVETSNMCQVSADLEDKMDEFESDQAQAIAEAFRDDDVIGEFEAEKEIVEIGEKPKDVDLNLQGWGSWAGPGTTEKKRRKFILKAKQKKRKDHGKTGVIIKEGISAPIEKLQVRSLPFPYTRVEDFQAVVSQPIGKDWNPQKVTKSLCKPAVVTQGGRSIRPLDKEETIKKKMYDSEDSD